MSTSYLWLPDVPHPPAATFVEHPRRAPFGSFVVFDLPPQPWPEDPQPTVYPPEVYGPPGTTWVFTEDQALDRLTPGDAGDSLLEKLGRLLKKLGARTVDGIGNWQVPYSSGWDVSVPPHVPEVYMRWWHVTIIGTLGTVEQVAHTFNFRTKPAPDVDQDAAAGQVFADQVKASWVKFLAGRTSLNAADKPNAAFSSDLKYTQVRATYLEQNLPAAITTHPGKRGPVKDFHLPRPTVLVPTQFSEFAPGSGNCSGGNTMPWEVACAVTLKTGIRGPRNRGRSYLGPISPSLMDVGGMFKPQAVGLLAQQFGQLFVQDINATSGNELHIVSRAYASSVPVTQVAIGHVPDSQRRRRRSQVELPEVVWTRP